MWSFIKPFLLMPIIQVVVSVILFQFAMYMLRVYNVARLNNLGVFETYHPTTLRYCDWSSQHELFCTARISHSDDSYRIMYGFHIS